MKRLDALDALSIKKNLPKLRSGDTVKVHVKVVEGTRSRIQIFQGVVTRIQGSGIGESFTVRKISFGTGVERTFPFHSPIIDKIELLSMGEVSRAKLYYLRDLTGKAAKIKERRGDLSAAYGAEEEVEILATESIEAANQEVEAPVETPAEEVSAVEEIAETPAEEVAEPAPVEEAKVEEVVASEEAPAEAAEEETKESN